MYIIGLFILMVLQAPSAYSETLSWDACILETSKNNSDLLSSRENLNAAKYQYKASFGAFLPGVTGDVSYNREKVDPTAAQNHFSTSLSGTQNLFSGLRDRSKVDQNQASFDLAETNYDSTKARVSFDLKSAFAGLLYVQSSVTLTEQITKRRQDNLDLVDLRYRVGRENKGSYYLSKAAWSQAKFENFQAKNAIEVNRQQLSRTLARDESAPLVLAGSIPVTPPSETPSFEQLVLQTPDHRAAIAQEHLSEATLMLARSPFYPSLDLSGSIGRQGDTFFPKQNFWNVGLSLSIPLFSGGKDYFTAKASAASFAASLSNRASVDRQVLTKLKQIYASYTEAIQKLEVDREFLEAASIRAEIARNKYNSGLLSFEDWDIIENDLISRQKTVLLSQRDRVTAEALWEQTQGKGIIP